MDRFGGTRILAALWTACLVLSGCDWGWPLDARYDPRRCSSSCGELQCINGECAPWDGGSSDGPVQDGKLADAPRAVPGKWVLIPAGTFVMGSPISEPCRELGDSKEDQHHVILTNDFEIQTTEVTQGQFTSLMGYNPSFYRLENYGTDCGTDCPVEAVRWYHAAAYCNELSKVAGKTPCYACSGGKKEPNCNVAAAYSGQNIYTCSGYRLPTEAEWEYTYRAGTNTALYNGSLDPAKCFSCSDTNADVIAWYHCNANTPQPVGQKQPNTWGIHEMAGNVSEWCHDNFQDSLGTLDVTNPVGSSGTIDRVERGGAYNGYGREMRAAYRNHSNPFDYHAWVGFRCARTIP